MLRRGWFVQVLAVSLFMIGAHRAAAHPTVEFSVSTLPLQRLVDWGITPTALDWDGHLELRAQAQNHVKALYDDLGLTVVRLTIGGDRDVYDENLGQAAPLPDSFFKMISLAETSHLRYIISILSVPLQLKTYYSNSAHVLLESNSLREENEKAFASYVADVLEQLHGKGCPPPAGLSIQMQPDNPTADFGIPITAAHGTSYTSEQWWRVLRLVRAELDRRGHSELPLIGPETYGVRGSKAWLGTNSPELGVREALLAGWAYQSDGAKNDDTGKEKSPADWRTYGQTGLWMLGSNCNVCKTDEDVVIETFLSMRHDLIDLGASHWFWRYAFDWNPSPEVLISGREGRHTPIYDALKCLWHAAPSGAVLRNLIQTGTRSDTVVGFAFETEHGVVSVCINSGGTPAAAVFRALPPRMRVNLFGAERKKFVTENSAEQPATIDLPARSIAIIVADRE